jgi:glycosyltransferase involved in cell wall biosynthesis
MKILLISSQDYIHHKVLSRHHNIFEDMASRHEIHVAHFHVTHGEPRYTKLIVEECTMFPSTSPLIHYTINAPYHFYVLDKIIKDNNIDIVVAAHVLAGTAAIRAAHKNNIPVLFDLKDWFPDSAAAYFKNKLLKDAVREAVWQVTKYNLSHSDKITTVSPSLVNKLKSLGFESELITNGVDTSLFKPMHIKREDLGIGLEQGEFVIGFVGSIERWYNLKEMIIAMGFLTKYNPNCKLLIVGGSLFTDYENELKQIVLDMNLSKNVIFTGLKRYTSLPKYINCMDVCVIPLEPKQWRDIALPNKYFEYTACGKPIVMTHMQDVEEICGANVFVYNNPVQYIEIMKSLMRLNNETSCDVSKDSWKQKSLEMETVLKNMVADK